MERQVFLIDKEKHKAAFSGLILPEVLPQLSEPEVFVVGAAEDSVPVGAAVVRLHEQLGELLSVAVAADRRREKIGTALLLHSVRALKQLSCQGLYGYLLQEDEEAAGLFRAVGMSRDKVDAVSFSGTLAQLRQGFAPGRMPHSISLGELPRQLFTQYTSQVLPQNRQVAGKDVFDPEMSRVIVRDGRVVACILIERQDDGLVIGWLHSMEAGERILLYLFRDALDEAARTEPETTQVRFLTDIPGLIRLGEKLLGKQAQKWTETRWALEHEAFRLAGLGQRTWEV